MPKALGRLGRCDHCDTPLSKEELALEADHGALRCSQCERTGRSDCMPAVGACAPSVNGYGVMLPEFQATHVAVMLTADTKQALTKAREDLEEILASDNLDLADCSGAMSRAVVAMRRVEGLALKSG